MRPWAILAPPVAFLLLGSQPTSAQTPGRDYRAVLDTARHDTAVTDSVRVGDLDLGSAAVGTDTFRAILRNPVASVVPVYLDLRTTVGL